MKCPRRISGMRPIWFQGAISRSTMKTLANRVTRSRRELILQSATPNDWLELTNLSPMIVYLKRRSNWISRRKIATSFFYCKWEINYSVYGLKRCLSGFYWTVCNRRAIAEYSVCFSIQPTAYRSSTVHQLNYSDKGSDTWYIS